MNKHKGRIIIYSVKRKVKVFFLLFCPVQSLHGMFVPESPQLPKFYTPIDDVDLSINICGIR